MNEDREPVDKHGCCIVWNNLLRDRERLTRKIMQRPELTVADLALQARVVALDNQEYWDGGEEARVGIATLKQLVESLCRLGGTETMPPAVV